MELSEDIRCNYENKKIYKQRKETIERLFGTAKEQHGFRYTQQIGKARMEMKVGLTYACLNLKKLAKMKQQRELLNNAFFWLSSFWASKFHTKRKSVLEFAF